MEMKTARTWWSSLLRQRCPHCREGKIFRSATGMNPTCPVCGLVWEREEGYFVGAMYFSYFLAVAVLCLFMAVWWWFLPTLDSGLIALLAILTFVPFVPLVFRYSRVTWIYFDRWAWPDKHSD
jgi:uncharacterized protein (DUF983 family)